MATLNVLFVYFERRCTDCTIVSTEAQINRYLYRKGQPQGIAPTSRP